MIDDENSGEDSLRRAISARPEDAERRVALVRLMGPERRGEALPILREGLVFAHDRPDRLRALAEGFMLLDALPEAVAVYQAVLRLDPENGEACARLARLWASLGEKARAEAIALQAARLGIDAGLGTVQDGPTESLTRHLFDQYAESFELHLQDKLGYAVPGHLEKVLQTFRAGGAERALDLGCGTGLMGPVLRPLARTLVGVDLSPAMLEKARQKNCYDELIEGDLARYLADCPPAGLIVAADVLVYVAEIVPVLRGVRRSLEADGLFAATFEAHDGIGFTLTPARRYAHSAPYLRETAASEGLALILCEPVTLRIDNGKPVAGWVTAFKPA